MLSDQNINDLIKAYNRLSDLMQEMLKEARKSHPDRMTMKQFLLLHLADGKPHGTAEIRVAAMDCGFKWISLTTFAANQKMVYKNGGRWKLTESFLPEARKLAQEYANRPDEYYANDAQEPLPRPTAKFTGERIVNGDSVPYSEISPQQIIEFVMDLPKEKIARDKLYVMCMERRCAIEHAMDYMKYRFEYLDRDITFKPLDVWEPIFVEYAQRHPLFKGRLTPRDIELFAYMNDASQEAIVEECKSDGWTKTGDTWYAPPVEVEPTPPEPKPIKTLKRKLPTITNE